MLDPHEALHQELSDRYELEDVLGEGGMGTVYLARDCKHDRQVAIKTIRPDVTTQWVRDRFEREISITAHLQHPHILPLLDSGVASETLYYVMPYVEGESLESRLARDSKLPIDEVVRVGGDVAEGLEYAHEQGVIHRDIKPGNILLTANYALIVDFGIAKALAETSRGKLTQTGFSPGSPHYMAPEQFEGRATAKSDIYSLGVVLYEAATGQGWRSGMEVEIDWAGVPIPLRAVIERALRPAPEERWSDAAEFRRALETSARPERQRWPATQQRAIVGTLAVVGALTLVAAALGLFQRGPGPTTRAVATQRQMTFVGNVAEARVSPRDDLLAYTTEDADGATLMVQDLESGSVIEIASSPDVIDMPSWSRDGRQILVRSGAGPSVMHLAYPRLGGDPRSIPVDGVSEWSADGRHVYYWGLDGRQIWAYTIASDSRVGIRTADTTAWIHDVAPHPGGSALAVVHTSRSGQESSSIWRLTIDSAQRFETMPRDSAGRIIASQYEQLVEGAARLYSVTWSPAGNSLYYLREDQGTFELWKLRTAANGATRDEPELLMSGLELTRGAGPWMSLLSLNEDGSQLFFVKGRAFSNLWSMRPRGEAWDVEPLTTGTGVDTGPHASPDGKWVAYKSRVAGRANLFVMPSEGGAARQITHVDSVSGYPVWSPDGASLAFALRRGGGNHVATVSVNGPARIRVFEATALSNNATITWAPGSEILYQHPGLQNFHFLNPETGAERPLLSADSAAVGLALQVQYSPDGTQVVLLRNRRPLDVAGLYVISLVDGVHRRLTSEPFVSPIGWSPDGRTVYALSQDNRAVLAVPVDGGSPTVLETLPFEANWVATTYNGRWFVFASSGATGDVWRIENFDPEP